MSVLYTIIVVVLAILALSGLYVGVTNDAVNFLNSAIGSKAAKMRTILMVASVGIIVGVVTSSGMMEVARHGMFNPSLFTFHEVMILYLSVMFANVILLDLYNSLGLPTSTTVSLVFCLLGSAIAVSIFKIAESEEWVFSDLGHFINTSRALGIVSAILLSVVIAFTCGTIVMYISRLFFSFRYTAMFRKFGAMWCGISLTAIVYFALFKGLKGLLAGHPFILLINDHILLGLLICWTFCSLVLFFLQRLKVNILRITILSGTFALALAFAGNDLVNFIGVPVASFDSYQIARAAGTTDLLMDALNEDVPANFYILLLAGVVMIITLWTSKKSMTVSQTELSLSAAQDDGAVNQSSSLFSRTLVRGALGINTVFESIVPLRVRERMDSRFEYEDIEHSGAPYDMIRATVNLTTAALLISLATSLKLPLSTTYVCFMVAMGSSLADKAWGRESAVYRITGVVTVVMGWFVTAIGGFLIAFAVGLILIYGGTIAIAVATVLCGWMLIHSNFKKRPKEEVKSVKKPETAEEILQQLSEEVCETMAATTRIYDRTLLAVFKENRKVLREMTQQADELYRHSSERKYSLMSTLKRLQASDINSAQYYVQVVDYLNEMTKALLHLTRPAFEHIDNNHEGLSKGQTEDLMHINDEVEAIYRQIEMMLRRGSFEEIDRVLTMRDNLFETIAEAIKSELGRINEVRSNTKASLLYLTILTETKNMVLQSRNLLKSQRYFVEHSGLEIGPSYTIRTE